MVFKSVLGFGFLAMLVFAVPLVAGEETMAVSADEIVSVYIDNELAGDQRFKGKKVKVSGTINRIASRQDGRPYVNLGTSIEIRGMLYCYFSEDQVPALVKLKKGQRFSTICTVIGTEFSSMVEMENCVID